MRARPLLVALVGVIAAWLGPFWSLVGIGAVAVVRELY
jgi:hypothetical protein